MLIPLVHTFGGLPKCTSTSDHSTVSSLRDSTVQEILVTKILEDTTKESGAYPRNNHILRRIKAHDAKGPGSEMISNFKAFRSSLDEIRKDGPAAGEAISLIEKNVDRAWMELQQYYVGNALAIFGTAASSTSKILKTFRLQSV